MVAKERYNNSMDTKAKLRTIDLSKILKPFQNKWVALSRDHKKVLASGTTVSQVVKNAEKTGQAYILHQVLPLNSLHVPVPFKKIK